MMLKSTKRCWVSFDTCRCSVGIMQSTTKQHLILSPDSDPSEHGLNSQCVLSKSWNKHTSIPLEKSCRLKFMPCKFKNSSFFFHLLQHMLLNNKYLILPWFLCEDTLGHTAFGASDTMSIIAMWWCDASSTCPKQSKDSLYRSMPAWIHERLDTENGIRTRRTFYRPP